MSIKLNVKLDRHSRVAFSENCVRSSLAPAGKFISYHMSKWFESVLQPGPFR